MTYQSPILPPLQAGTEVGRLNVMCNDVVVQVTPLYAAETVEEGDIVRKALDALPERERLVIALYYYENLTLREIGEVLGVTESRVSQLHTKAVLGLRSRFGSQLAPE